MFILKAQWTLSVGQQEGGQRDREDRQAAAVRQF